MTSELWLSVSARLISFNNQGNNLNRDRYHPSGVSEPSDLHPILVIKFMVIIFTLKYPNQVQKLKITENLVGTQYFLPDNSMITDFKLIFGIHFIFFFYHFYLR